MRLDITLTCSNCGRHQELSNEKMQDTADVISAGWGSCGGALYCPECSRTWGERNPGRPMSDDRNTFFVIMSAFMRAKKGGDS